MASYRQYRSSSNYRERTRSRGEEPSLDYTDPYLRWNASQTPVVGDFLRASDQTKYWNDYLRNSQMTWDDVKYPALLGGTSPVGAISRTMNTGVSIGILRKMYR